MLCVYSTYEISCWLDRTGSGLQLISLRKQRTFRGAIIVCCLVCSCIMTSVAPDWSCRKKLVWFNRKCNQNHHPGLASDTLTWNLSALSPKSLNRRRPAFYGKPVVGSRNDSCQSSGLFCHFQTNLTITGSPFTCSCVPYRPSPYQSRSPS